MAQTTTYVINSLKGTKYELEAAFPDKDKAEAFIAKMYQHRLEKGTRLPDLQVIKCVSGDEFSTMKIQSNYNVVVELMDYPVANPA